LFFVGVTLKYLFSGQDLGGDEPPKGSRHRQGHTGECRSAFGWRGGDLTVRASSPGRAKRQGTVQRLPLEATEPRGQHRASMLLVTSPPRLFSRSGVAERLKVAGRFGFALAVIGDIFCESPVLPFTRAKVRKHVALAELTDDRHNVAPGSLDRRPIFANPAFGGAR